MGVTQEVVRQIPRVMTQEVVRQVPKIMVQEVVRQIAAPAPVVVQQAPQIIETIAPVMATPMFETFAPAPFMSAPIVETFGAGYGYGAPVVETFGAGYGYGAPLVGSISASLPMTTMAAPTMTTMGATVGAFGSPLVGTSYGLPPTVL